MKYVSCFSTLGCAELSLTESVRLAADYGLTAIEVRSLGGAIEGLPALREEFGSPARLAEWCRGQSVKVIGWGSSAKLGCLGEQDWAALHEVMPWLEAIGGVNYRLFDGPELLQPAVFEQAGADLQRWQQLRRAQGWRTDWVIETHDSLLDQRSLSQFLKAYPEARLLWDTHHTWKKGGEAPGDTWRALAAQTVHLHVKDSISRPSDRHPFTYVAPGEGEYPWEALRSSVLSTSHSPVSLEWERVWHPYLSPLSGALAKTEQAGW